MEQVFGIVAPVFTVIAMGFVAGKAGIFAAGAARGLSVFVFMFAVPALLFRAMVSLGFPDEPPWALWLAFFGAAAVVWGLALLAARRVSGLAGAGGAAAALGAGFGNTVMLGLPLGVAAFGDAAVLPMALILAIHLPLQWFVAMLVANAASASHHGGGTIFLLARLVRDLTANPIVMALLAGSAWNFTGLGLHPVFADVIGMLGAAAVPAALFALGISVSRLQWRGSLTAVCILLGLKMLVMPAMAAVLAIGVLELDRVTAGVVVLFAALPTGANAYIFAERYAVAEAAVSGSIAVGTAISVVSLTLVLLSLGV